MAKQFIPFDQLQQSQAWKEIPAEQKPVKARGYFDKYLAPVIPEDQREQKWEGFRKKYGIGEPNEIVETEARPRTIMIHVQDEDEAGFLEKNVNAAKRGLLGFESSVHVARALLGDESAFDSIAETQKKINQIPISKEQQEFFAPGGLGRLWDQFKESPFKTSNIIGSLATQFAVESAGQFLPTVPASLGTAGLGAAAGSAIPGVGTAAGGLLGFAGGTGLSSAAIEYTSQIIGSLKEAGINVEDSAALKAAFANEELMGPIKEQAAIKAGVVGAGDAFLTAFGGRVVTAPARKATSKVTSEALAKGVTPSLAKKLGSEAAKETLKGMGKGELAARGAAELGIQATGGAGFEAASQVLSGQEFSGAETLAEGLGELVPGGVNIAVGAVGRSGVAPSKPIAPAAITTEDRIQTPVEPVPIVRNGITYKSFKQEVVVEARNKLIQQMHDSFDAKIGRKEVDALIDLIDGRAVAFSQRYGHTPETYWFTRFSKFEMQDGKPTVKLGDVSEFLQEVHHGTPYTFAPEEGFPHGRFRLDKIGSGEGAQAFGWGIYFADREGVARSYRDVTSRDKSSETKDNSSLYKLELPDDIQPFLLKWDEPLSQQTPEVQDALEKAVSTIGDYVNKDMFPDGLQNLTGEQIYKKLTLLEHRRMKDPNVEGGMLPYYYAPGSFMGDRGSKIASSILAEAGILGNKYYDAASRFEYEVVTTENGRYAVAKVSGPLGYGGRVNWNQDFATREEAQAEADRLQREGKRTYNYVIWDQPTLDRIVLLERNGEKLDAMRKAEAKKQIDDLFQTTTAAPPFRAAQIASENFRRWFRNSVLRDDRGEPIILFHGTTAGRDFTVFNTVSVLQLGAHVGPYDQANEFGNYISSREPGRVYPLYVRIENPLRLMDKGAWRVKDVVPQLLEKGLIDNDRAQIIYDTYRDFDYPSDATKYLQNVIRGLGFDGVVYLNRIEGVGPRTEGQDLISIDQVSDARFKEVYPEAKDAYIVFDPTQLKSAIANTGEFSNENTSILHQASQAAIKGKVRFDKDGRAIITAFQSADISTLLHELGHVFRRDLEGDDLAIVEKWAGVKDHVWTRKAEEKFARAFERYLRRGKSPTPSLDRIFRYFKEWLSNIYKKIRGSEIDVRVPEEISKVFDNLLRNDMDFVIRQRQEIEARKLGRLQKAWRRFVATVDVETPWIQRGAPETGFQIKNYSSNREFEETKGLEVMTKIRDAAMRAKLTREEWNQIPFLAEAQEAQETLSPRDKERFGPILKLWSDYREEAFQRLQAEGGIQERFTEKIMRLLRTELLEAERLGDTKTVQELKDALEVAQKTEFVHIPVAAIFEKMVEENKTEMLRRSLALQVDKNRKTIRLADFVKPGEIDIYDVIGSYMQRMGRDMSLLKIVNAAKAEKLAVPASVAPNEYYAGSKVSSVLKHWALDPMLHKYLEELTTVKHPSWFDNALSMIKMMSFYNPIFLPMLDIFQAALTGAINPLRPSFYSDVARGIFDVVTKSDRYYAGLQDGLMSTPFNTPFSVLETKIRKLRASALGKPQRSLMKAIVQEYGGLRPFYNATWSIAWEMDNVVRYTTYNYLLRKGMTSRDAAQTTAKFTGDYAGVPAKTRRSLNRIFFTPTYKIAMGKVYGNMLVQALKKAAGNEILQEVPNIFARAAIILLATQMSKDLLMTALGFDVEEWGRKYVWKGISTPEGEKEFVITISDPTNMFQKYFTRFQQAFFDPKTENGIEYFVNSNSWEFHPFWRAAVDLVGNYDSMNRTPIFERFDTDVTKARKIVGFLAGRVVPVTGAVAGEAGDLFRTSEPLRDPDLADKIMVREFGWITNIVSKLVAFPYVRTNEIERASNAIDRMGRDIRRQQNRALMNGTLSAESFDKSAAQYFQDVDSVLSEIEESYEVDTWNKILRRAVPFAEDLKLLKKERATDEPPRKPALVP